MPCDFPLKAYRSKVLSVNGKRPLVFVEKDSTGETQEIPCGQCTGCRLQRSSEWASRISCEASLYDKNCFITLTYSPENLPSDGSLDVRHFQLFMKKLRKKYGKNIRFFHCGEYGENLGRPHYHACLLNFDFPDKSYLRTTDRGDMVYHSASLSLLWGLGRTEIGSLTYESAAYAARYCTKKVTGRSAEAHYSRVCVETGEIITLKPEYTTMSRKPGIGAPWLRRFKTDVYNHDHLIIRGGSKVRPPRFFDNHLEKLDPQRYRQIKMAREQHERNIQGTAEYDRHQSEQTDARRYAKKTVRDAQMQSIKRNYEKE